MTAFHDTLRARQPTAPTRLVLVGVVAAACVSAWMLAQGHGRARATAVEAEEAAQAGASSRILGATSCSSTACHGRVSPAPGQPCDPLRNEYTTWVSDDPHSRAYASLFNERSRRMVRALAPDPGTALPAHQDPRCLACHATPRTEEQLRVSASLNADGVGCESCHGAAERWLGPHTTAGWTLLDPAVKESRFGLIETGRLARRVAMCAGCHIGRRDDPAGRLDRDVNHDLIAAGHPRLAFEFAAYQENQPPHWDRGCREQTPDDAARAWLVGQFVTAKASLELLRARASEQRAPWPEFSEYGCYSCHHDLKDETWRHAGLSGARNASSWATWPLSVLPLLSEQDAPITMSLKAATQAMERLGPDRNAVAARANEAAVLLADLSDRAEIEPLDASRIAIYLHAIESPESWLKVRGWDEAAQRYLGMVPLSQSLRRLDPARVPPDFQTRLESLRDRLQFPPSYDSPRGFRPGENGR